MVYSLFNLGSTYLKTKFENTLQLQKNDSQIYSKNYKNLPLKIVGTGMYVPPKVETAAEVATRINRSEDWVTSHAGVNFKLPFLTVQCVFLRVFKEISFCFLLVQLR